MNNLVPRGTPQRVSASQPLVLEGRDSPLRAELKSPVMKEGTRPDHNTNPPLPARQSTDKCRWCAGCQLDPENGRQLDFALFYLKFLSIPLEWIKCEHRTEKAAEHLHGGNGTHQSQQRRTVAQRLCPQRRPLTAWELNAVEVKT